LCTRRRRSRGRGERRGKQEKKEEDGGYNANNRKTAKSMEPSTIRIKANRTFIDLNLNLIATLAISTKKIAHQWSR